MTDLHSLHATRRQLRATITVMEKETGSRTRPQRVLLLQALRDIERLYTDNIAAELRREREEPTPQRGCGCWGCSIGY